MLLYSFRPYQPLSSDCVHCPEQLTALRTQLDPSTLNQNTQVSSTETGAIFGNIVYETTGHTDRCVVVLNDIHIDIMDYISPAACADVQFRSMWAEFEWENKVGGG